MDVMEIGWFQVENLLLHQVPFLFLDVSKEEISASHQVDDKVARLLARAQKVLPQEIEPLLADKAQDFPVVLVCESGQTSLTIGEKLAQQGFLNIYIVEGGKHGFQGEV